MGRGSKLKKKIIRNRNQCISSLNKFLKLKIGVVPQTQLSLMKLNLSLHKQMIKYCLILIKILQIKIIVKLLIQKYKIILLKSNCTFR
jgi:hypothetical protein